MSEDNKVTVTARVRVVLDIPLAQPWGNAAPLQDVWKQARENAVAIVHRQFEGHYGARIIGDPEVTAVFVPEKAR